MSRIFRISLEEDEPEVVAEVPAPDELNAEQGELDEGIGELEAAQDDASAAEGEQEQLEDAVSTVEAAPEEIAAEALALAANIVAGCRRRLGVKSVSAAQEALRIGRSRSAVLEEAQGTISKIKESLKKFLDWAIGKIKELADKIVKFARNLGASISSRVKKFKDWVLGRKVKSVKPDTAPSFTIKNSGGAKDLDAYFKALDEIHSAVTAFSNSCFVKLRDKASADGYNKVHAIATKELAKKVPFLKVEESEGSEGTPAVLTVSRDERETEVKLPNETSALVKILEQCEEVLKHLEHSESNLGSLEKDREKLLADLPAETGDDDVAAKAIRYFYKDTVAVFAATQGVYGAAFANIRGVVGLITVTTTYVDANGTALPAPEASGGAAAEEPAAA